MSDQESRRDPLRLPKVLSIHEQTTEKNIAAHVVFICVIVLFFFLIISYAIHQKHLSGYADIFHKATDKEEAVWIRLAIIALVNLFVFSSIIFIDLLIFLKRKNNS